MCAWPARVFEFTRAHLPRSTKVTYTSHAQGSTTSTYSAHVAMETYYRHPDRPIDLVLVDHSANDLSLLGPSNDTQTLSAAVELLVRAVLSLPQRPALVYLVSLTDPHQALIPAIPERPRSITFARE